MTRIVTALVMFALVLTSCSKDETIEDVTVLGADVGLKTYTLSKDINGNYSIDYEVNDYTTVQTVTNTETNATEFYLSAGNIAEKKKSEKNLVFENDYLEVGFYQEATATRGLFIEDDNSSAAESDTYLESYSIQDLGNDTYKVDFKVKEGIAVSFEYNEDDNIYEIHLKEGTSDAREFTKIFVKKYDVIKVDFVNFPRGSAKAVSVVRRPRSAVLS